ncbi:MAG: Ti-type conjugative transfer relaxase TraA [Alphaproteobacteria bacterium]|nr:Ti-type conjugative transfer relaxase TraA [Alphaproteobacteria bacterium]
MAIYHFSAKVIGRSAGRSAVASAAYRAAERLHDDKLGRAHDYREKAGVIHSEILLPEGAPARWLDRGTLWNEVEAGEKRKDAQLARDLEISLPRELSQAEAIALARDFAREQFVDCGMVADLNVHWIAAADGELQPHAHVMLTMREIIPGPEGEGAFGKKVVAWNDRTLLVAWRERWASMTNERLLSLGYDIRIDHRSYAEQGLALEPQHKIGPAGFRRSAREENAERAAEHIAIARRNGEKIIEDPGLVLDAITRQHSTFTRRDLARFVDRHTADREQFERAMAKAEACPELVRLGIDGRGQERFSTREMLATERRMEMAAGALAERDRHRVSLVAGWRALRDAEQGGLTLGEEQRAAYRHVTSGADLSLVVGYAGTGKSAMLGVARQAWEAQGLTVRGAALSGIAAEGLEAGSGIQSRTLASLEWGWKESREALSAKDVLVIDEAGLVGSRQLERVLSQAQSVGAKVVLVGDPEQLQAIEAGAAFRALAERHGAVEITEIRRQREDWQRDATRELATGRTAEALGRYAQAGMVRMAETHDAARAALVEGWETVRRERPHASPVMLAYTRADVAELNRLAREHLRAAGALGPEQAVAIERGERLFARGDRIMFLRNERGLGVKNGTLGTVERVDGQGLTVRLDGAGRQESRKITFGLGDYADLDHGYAATIHKAQGVTVDRAHVLASPHMDRHAAYVALTRHRDGVALHYGRDAFADAGRLARGLGRERAKDTTLDYETAFAERRGLDPLRPVSEIVLAPEAPAPRRQAALDQGQEEREAQSSPGQAVKREAVSAEEVAQGRAGFRARYQAHRQAVERDAKARELVASWDRLASDFRLALSGRGAEAGSLDKARAELQRFGAGLREQPELVRVLRERGAEFGLEERKNLARVLADPEPRRAIAGMTDAAEAHVRELLRQRAEIAIERQRKELSQRRSLGRGMGMGL